VAVPYANLTNPQTLNLYAMVGDDPESFADLDGHAGAGYPEPNNCMANQETCPQTGALNDGGPSSPNPAGYSEADYEKGLEQIQQQQGVAGGGGSPQEGQQVQQGTSGQPSSTQQTLSAVKVDDGGDYLRIAVDWKLSGDSKTGGWVVQHVIGDWNKNSAIPGHREYWEAWYISAGKNNTNYHIHIGFDDQFTGGFGTKIHAEARFYEGLKLPSTFKPGGVDVAGGLRSTYSDPHLSTTHATPPIIRDWKP